MALATNARQQMARRLQQSLQLTCPEYQCSLSSDASGNPALQLQDPANDMANVAILDLAPKSFSGFNLVAELSPSSAVGLPETDLYLVILDSLKLDKMAKLMKAADRVGAASLKLCIMPSATHPVLSIADASDANLSIELPNDAQVGFSGN